MARSEARVKTSIWLDADFTERSAPAQRLYLLLLSQAPLNFCGVIAYTPKRWAAMAPDTDMTAIEAAVTELETYRYIVVDRDTEELLVRSFARHDVLGSPNIERAMWKDYGSMMSRRLRDAFVRALPEEVDLPEGVSRPPPEPLSLTPSVTLPVGLRAHAQDPLPPPLPPPPRAPTPSIAEFDDWYEAYPRKVARGAATAAYVKARKKASVADLVAGLDRWNRQWQSENRPQDKIPHPATWLNAGCWQDELSEGVASAAVHNDSRVSYDEIEAEIARTSA